MICHYAEFCYAKCRVLFMVVLSVIMLTVVMLTVIMLNAVALNVAAPWGLKRQAVRPKNFFWEVELFKACPHMNKLKFLCSN